MTGSALVLPSIVRIQLPGILKGSFVDGVSFILMFADLVLIYPGFGYYAYSIKVKNSTSK